MAKANTNTNSAREKSKDLPITQPVYAGRTDAKVPGGDQYLESEGAASETMFRLCLN
jgi:hypothetical protein